MRVRKDPMTPLAAVVVGLLAGAAGTVCLDAVHYLKYRRAGGTDGPRPGNSRRSGTGRRPVPRGRSPGACSKGFTQRKLPDCSAWLTSTIAHWAYGSATGAAYAIVAGSLPAPHPRYACCSARVAFAGDYTAAGAALPADLEVRCEDLGLDLDADLADGVARVMFWVRPESRDRGSCRNEELDELGR